MSRKTPRSALANTKLDLKNGQQKSPQMNTKAVMDEINELKIQTSQMDNETKQLKSKISRMKQILHDRNTQINKALTQTSEQQAIKTASQSTLDQLRENIAALENTLHSREIELEKLRENDKLTMSEELQVEVLEYYNEHERLSNQIAAVHEGENVIGEEISRAQQEVLDEAQHEREIYDLQVQVHQLADKLVAYLQGEYRVTANSKIEQIEHNPDIYSKLKKELQENIKEMEKSKEEQEEMIKIILENDEKKKQYLQKILESQAQKLSELIEKQRAKGDSSPTKMHPS